MSLFSTLYTGTSGLRVSELSIATTGHNISNSNNDFYTRQRVVTQAQIPFHTTPGDVGTGVKAKTVARLHDEFVYTRLKRSSTSLSYDTFNKKTLEEVTKYFPDLKNVGIGNDIEKYFTSWNDLASNPDDASQKIALVQNSITLSNNLRETRENVRFLQNSINEQLKTNVDEINRIGKELSKVNIAISRVEVLDSNRANDLRDQRDNLELTLSELVNISVFKGDLLSENHIDQNLTDKGTGYHLNITGHSFVDGFTFHPLEINNTGNSNSYYSVYSKSQDGSLVEVTGKLVGGKVGSMLDLRGRAVDAAKNSGFPSDGLLQGYVDDLDTFAKTFVEQTNSIYARSAQEHMSSFSNKDLNDKTNLINYNESINRGSFDVIMYNNQGVEIGRKSIDIHMLTTINKSTVDKLGVSNKDSIVDQFNANSDDNNDNNGLNDINDYFTAVFNFDENQNSGVLAIDAKDSLSGYTIAIDDHDTNFAGAIGLSQFLLGSSASDMGVVLKYRDDSSKINAHSAPVEGNNDVANDMLQMQYDKFEFHRAHNISTDETIEGFYRFITTQIATDTESANRNFETNTSLFNTVNSEFQSISGVNMNEELTDLIRFQAAYGANAKVITTIDRMIDTLLGIKQ